VQTRAATAAAIGVRAYCAIAVSASGSEGPARDLEGSARKPARKIDWIRASARQSCSRQLSGPAIRCRLPAAILRPSFSVQEEWSYVDRDSSDLRSLDILAGQELFDLHTNPQPRVRPELNLLIECKQSQLPYVFFLAGETPWGAEIPLIAGLHEDSILYYHR
jgi:hypothetical protein